MASPPTPHRTHTHARTHDAHAPRAASPHHVSLYPLSPPHPTTSLSLLSLPLDPNRHTGRPAPATALTPGLAGQHLARRIQPRRPPPLPPTASTSPFTAGPGHIARRPRRPPSVRRCPPPPRWPPSRLPAPTSLAAFSSAGPGPVARRPRVPPRFVARRPRRPPRPISPAGLHWPRLRRPWLRQPRRPPPASNLGLGLEEK